MTASAVVGVINAESFEGNNTFTGVTWAAGGPLPSAMVPGTNGLSDASSPMAGTDTQVLQLNTEAGVWTNTVNQPFAEQGNPAKQLYVDMLVKFVPSEELPDISSLSGKLALAVKADATETNRLNISWYNSGGFQAWSNISSKVISTTSWHRVTVRLYIIDEATPKTTVLLDGDPIFDQTMDGVDQVLYSIGFQGTGFIDELVVRDDPPTFGGAAIQITLSFTTGIATVFVGETQKLDTETVDSGSDLIITAAQWKEISSVAGTDVTTDWVLGAQGDAIATVKVSATSSGKTVTITPATETSTAETSGSGTSFDGAAMNKVAAWALANGVTTLTSGIYTNYLYNIDDAATVPELLIKSIAVTNTTVTVTVGAGTNNLSILNGVLKLKAWPVLGGTPESYTNEVGIVGTTNVTVQVNIGTNKFVKALIE
jgi:hypothetical protein